VFVTLFHDHTVLPPALLLKNAVYIPGLSEKSTVIVAARSLLDKFCALCFHRATLIGSAVIADGLSEHYVRRTLNLRDLLNRRTLRDQPRP
jgi:hypothetical protein